MKSKHSATELKRLALDGALAACEARAAVIFEGIAAAGLAAGKRSETDAFEVYTGYTGPVTWEWQFESCLSTIDPGAPTECSCNGINNADAWYAAGNAVCDDQWPFDSDDSWCLSPTAFPTVSLVDSHA